MRNWAVDRGAYRSEAAVPSERSLFVTLAPCRLVDTRYPSGAYGGPAFTAGTTRTFAVPTGFCAGIPAEAAAYSLNFTATNTVNTAWLTAWPTGQPKPFTSTLNWGAGLTLANSAIVPAGTSGSIDVYANGGADVIIDINGYFIEQHDGVNGLTATGDMTAGVTVLAFTRGGRLVMEVGGSAFRSASSGSGFIGFNVSIDGDTPTLAARVYTNETVSHKAMVSFPVTFAGLTPGVHTVTFSGANPETKMDVNDVLVARYYETGPI
jgi:hypothetical protein